MASICRDTAVPATATLLQSLCAVEKIPAKRGHKSDKLDPVSDDATNLASGIGVSRLTGIQTILARKGTPMEHMNSTGLIFGHELDSDCQPVQLVRGGCDLDAISLPAWHHDVGWQVVNLV